MIKMAENLEQKMNEVLSVGLPYVQMKGLVEQFEKTPTDYKVFDAYKNFAFRDLPQDVREASLKEIEAKIEAKDFKSIREKYAETFKSAEWQDFIKNTARNEFIATFAPLYFKYEHNKFIGQFASTREVDGKQEAYLDRVKLIDYLNKKVESAKDDKAKKKIFFQAGKSLSEHKLQELIQEQEEKAEKEDKDKKKAA